MFKENKYTSWYRALIQKARDERRVRTRAWQYHAHHIIPSSLGGSNEQNNLVLLTPREHYLSHLLLTRMTSGSARAKMVFAFFRFRPKDANVTSSKRYERHLTFLTPVLSGEGNPFFGRQHSSESRAKIVANHGMRGKTYYDIWIVKFGHEEARRMKAELKALRSKSVSGSGNAMFGKTHSPEWRMCHSSAMTGENNPNFGKTFVWMNRAGKTRKVPLDEVAQLLLNGWVKGRAGSGAPVGRVCTEETKAKRRATRLTKRSL